MMRLAPSLLKNLLKTLCLIALLGILPTPSAAEPKQGLIIGGPLRAGGFNLSDSAKEVYLTSLSFADKELENALGKQLFVIYYWNRFGIGARWMNYQLEGGNTDIEQELNLDYSLLTLSFSVLEGDFLHPKLDSRLGISYGRGLNRLQLNTRSAAALTTQTLNETMTRTEEAVFMALTFQAITRSRWGYQMEYFNLSTHQTRTDGGQVLNRCSANKIAMTLIWRY